MTRKKHKGFCDVGKGLFKIWVLVTLVCSVSDNLLSFILIYIFVYIYDICISILSIAISLLHLFFLAGWWQSWQRLVPLLLSIELSWMRILRLWLLFYFEWLIQLLFSTAPVSAILRTRVACSGFGICPSFSLQVEGVIWVASKHTSEARLFFGWDEWALEPLSPAQGLPDARRLRRCHAEGTWLKFTPSECFSVYKGPKLPSRTPEKSALAAGSPAVFVSSGILVFFLCICHCEVVWFHSPFTSLGLCLLTF